MGSLAGEQHRQAPYLIEQGLVPAGLSFNAVHDLLEQQQGSFCGADVEQAGVEAEDPHAVGIPSPAHGGVIGNIVIPCRITPSSQSVCVRILLIGK